MRYLITTNVQAPFLTNWFDMENHFSPSVQMVVYDLLRKKYTDDGVTWKDIKTDQL